MIVGLGMDIVGMLRISEAITRLGDRFLRRIYTADEIAYCKAQKHPAPHYAARFAAKEAALKALGTGLATGATWHDVEVHREVSGRPALRLSGQSAGLAESMGVGVVHVTLSHTHTHASAVVILERP